MAFSGDETIRQEYAAGMFQALLEEGEIDATERYEERKRLYGLLDRLVENSGGKFKNREDVFGKLAEANFSGNYLSIAPIIENILGKGSFRKTAEEFSG
jgi:hypothetical protein